MAQEDFKTPLKPMTWQEAAKIVDSPLVLHLMRIRLVELVFSQDSAVALRAYELFIGSGSSSALSSLLVDIPDAKLGELLDVVAKRLRATATSGGEVDAGSGTGAPEDT